MPVGLQSLLSLPKPELNNGEVEPCAAACGSFTSAATIGAGTHWCRNPGRCIAIVELRAESFGGRTSWNTPS